jgi:hypothetical protein
MSIGRSFRHYLKPDPLNDVRASRSTVVLSAKAGERLSFIQFLTFLAEAAERHPERLGTVFDLTDEDADLLEGIVLPD